jgi:hypothetical protein
MNSEKKDFLFYAQVFKVILVIVFIITNVNSIAAQGDLIIYPKRIVFKGKVKIKKLTLANIGKDTAVYNISFLEYKMDENGELKIISEAEEGLNFSSSNVRFYPRKVTLAPNESQKVKIQVKNTRSLKDGEYRSHLYFRAEEDKKPLGNTTKEKDSTISIQLKTVFGISIPCIIKKGVSTTSVNITDLKLLQLDNHENILQFNLNRLGNMSTYGDFTINYLTPNNKVYILAKIKGVGVYTPGNLRIIKMRINKPKNLSFDKGTLQVIFTENESKKRLTEANLKL